MEIWKTIKETIRDGIDTANDYLNEELSVTRKTILIMGSVFVLIGTIYGFLIAPVKKGIQINVSNTLNRYDEDDCE